MEIYLPFSIDKTDEIQRSMGNSSLKEILNYNDTNAENKGEIKDIFLKNTFFGFVELLENN